MSVVNNRHGAIVIEGHVQGLSNTRSLGEIGIPVYVVDTTNCIAKYSKYCRKFFICPDFASDEFADFLIELARKEYLKDWLLLPSNDHAVLTISKNKQKLENVYKVITPTYKIIENIYDKSKLLNLSQKIGVHFPKTFYINSEDDLDRCHLPFPVIIKGRHGLSFYKLMRKKVFVANDNEELKKQLNDISNKTELKNTFIQEVIPFNGSNYTTSFTAFCSNGAVKTFWMGEKLREHPTRFGTATFCVSTFNEELIEPSSKLIKSLNYTGICEIEYIRDPRDNGYKLIEINARSWLWVELAKTCGINFTLIAYDFIYKDKDVYHQDYRIGIKWINYLTDIPFSVKAIFKGRLNIKSYLRSLKGIKSHALWNKDDPKPFISYILLSMFYLKKR
jgi:predicted ATP-grasp superfamily ATP-dependent carboligase